MKKALLSLTALAPTIVLAEGGQAAPNHMANLIMLGLFIGLFYLLLIRPQAKRAKAHQALLSSIAKDDEVVTAGGIIGKVLKVTEQFYTLAIAEGIEVKVQKQAITATLPKGTMKDV